MRLYAVLLMALLALPLSGQHTRQQAAARHQAQARALQAAAQAQAIRQRAAIERSLFEAWYGAKPPIGLQLGQQKPKQC